MLQIRQSIKQVPINLDFSRKMKDHKENLMTWKENKYKIREVEAASSSLVIPICKTAEISLISAVFLCIYSD